MICLPGTHSDHHTGKTNIFQHILLARGILMLKLSYNNKGRRYGINIILCCTTDLWKISM